MKKKVCFLCATILLVCVMALALVGCNNEIEPFAVEDKATTLDEIWNAWSTENFNASSNTLGLDIDFSVKNGESEVNIKVKGGISTKENSKNAISFLMTIKSNDVVSSTETIIDNEAMYVTKNGSTIKNSAYKLPDITGSNVDFADVISTAKDFLLPLIANSIDETNFMIAPVKNGKKYDVKYTFSIKVDDFIDEILAILNTFDTIDTSNLPEEFAGILEMIGPAKETLEQFKEEVKGVTIDVTINTTENTKTKEKDKVTYSGGKLTSFEVKTKIAEKEVVFSGNIKLTNTFEEITIPTEWTEIEQNPDQNPDQIIQG